MTPNSLPSRPRPRRGLSIVELLVGVAVGMFVLAGAAMVVSNQLSDNKRLLLETQIQQDMRSAMDIIVRDVRRSGYSYWADVLPAVGGAARPQTAFKSAGGLSETNPLQYTYHLQNGDPPAMTEVGPINEDRRGFRLRSGVLEVELGLGNWQALTDRNVVTIERFDVAKTETPLVLPTCQTPPCASANACGNQRVVTRRLDLTMVGVAAHDPTVRRRVDASVRVRNDEVCL